MGLTSSIFLVVYGVVSVPGSYSYPRHYFPMDSITQCEESAPAIISHLGMDKSVSTMVPTNRMTQAIGEAPKAQMREEVRTYKGMRNIHHECVDMSTILVVEPRP